MFVKFKMSEGQKSFSRYLAQFRYLLTWSVRLQRSNAVRALFLASTNSFLEVGPSPGCISVCPVLFLQFVARPTLGLGVGLTTPHRKIRRSY